MQTERFSKTDDIDDLADKVQFIAASIPEPWATHASNAAHRMLEMAAAGDRMAAQLDMMLAGNFHTDTEIVDILTAWEQA